LVWVIYSPGLHGGFLFDDFANLPSLGAQGPIDNWPAFWRYITSGHADPTGRPVAMLSFLMDARDWPAAPFPFKRTNLLLHLANGTLLALLLRRLGRSLVEPQGLEAPARIVWRTDLAAVLAASIWLLHPLWVSTTLYIVQREAILPATFTLLGLLLWLRGREALSHGRTGTGLLQITAGLGACTLLGILCKANGVLLPLLALTIEYTALRCSTKESTPIYRQAMYLLAWLPAALVALYLAWEGARGLLYGISAIRPWTLGQRLLTEPRVLVDYLALLWLPRPFTAGLFNDQVQASTSLLNPISTLLSLCLVSGLIFAACHIRKRHPALAAAILFFFIGQSLESSTVALELYFEHRNYLPAMLMFWPLALWLCNASLNSKLPMPGIGRPVLALAIVAGLSAMTHAGAGLWGNSRDQSILWAKLNPDSPRAQVNAAQDEMNSGRPDLAAERLRPLLTKHPDQVQLALNLFGAECLLGNVSDATLNAAQTSLATTRDPGTLLTNWFTRIIGQTRSTSVPCPQLTSATIEKLLDAAASNPNFKDTPGRLQDVYYLKGLLALRGNRPTIASQNFNRALDLQVRAAIALKQAALLGASGYPQLGLDHLARYESLRSKESKPEFGMPRLHAWVLQRQQYWPHELARLQATLQQDAIRRTSGPQ
jgi:tetratricopeptide (TPR) repeat protein